MAMINFVPDDYVQQRRASRANVLYLMLLIAMLGAIGITFSFIKIRQRTVLAELTQLNGRMAQAQQKIAQLEELKTKSKTMMKTMVMTAELLEPVPRSIVLASLTNNLPSGVSLVDFSLEEEETKVYKPSSAKKTAGSRYNKTNAAAAAAEEPQKTVTTDLQIKGIAPSDIQVAEFIANLSGALLFDDVSLIESKEIEIKKVKYREFQLKAAIQPDLALTKEDIDGIRQKREEV